MSTEVRPRDWPRGSGYAHGYTAKGELLFVSGQIGWDTHAQVLVGGGLVAQTRRALENVVTVLSAAGAEPSNLVRLTWFITDREAYLRDRGPIGEAYRDVVGRHFPAMSVIFVAGLVEPGALVEIEATAVIPPIAPPSKSTGA